MRLLLVTTLLGSGVGSQGVARAQRSVSNEPSRSVDRDTTPRLPVRFVKRPEPETRPADPSPAATEDSRYGQPIKLPAPEDAPAEGDREPGAGHSTDGGSVTWVVLSSLAIVLGLFFLVVWLARRALPRSAVSLPKDVLEVLGRSPLAARHNLQLIRLGQRLLLVSVTPETAETLAEITDVDEVNHLAGLCRQNQPDSITGSFRQALHQLGSPQQAGDEGLGGTSNQFGFGADAGQASRTPLQHVRKRS
ncbi:MAG: FliO/MopB family protein [Planctomycetota bacterium]